VALLSASDVERPLAGGPWAAAPAATRVGVVTGALVVAAAVVGVLAPASGAAGPALLVLAGLVGLPHGAVDHLALGWARGRTGAAPVRVLVAYATGAVAAALAALAFPVPAVLALLVLSVLHFAEGEAAFDRLRGGPGLRLPSFAVGLAVVALPVLLRPDPVRPLLAALDPALPGVVQQGRTPVLVVTALVVAAGLAVALAARAWTAAAELVVVVAAALLAPPLLVFAAWFGGWHAPRHLVRLLDLQPDGDLRRRLRRLTRSAVAPTAAALAGLAALVAVGRDVPAAVLVVLLALTVPHAVVVARLGRDAERVSSG
jgi:Brp/Blh family beta-carotene 15,15'-monooxygenase